MFNPTTISLRLWSPSPKIQGGMNFLGEGGEDDGIVGEITHPQSIVCPPRRRGATSIQRFWKGPFQGLGFPF